MRNILSLLLCFIFFGSCSELPELNTQNYEVVGEEGNMGLQTKEGKIVMEKKYKSIGVHKDYRLDEHYVDYRTNEGGRGFFFDNFEEPAIEVGDDFYYIKVINSKKYFVFAKHEKNAYDYSWVGVMDKDQNVIIKNEHLQIQHDGNKLFFVTDETNKNFKLYGMDGKPINSNQYGMVSSRFGVTFASVYQNGGGDIWGAKGCLLDENGNEITSHDYQSVSAWKCLFDESKIFLYMRKDGINSLYYPDGERIYKEKLVNMMPFNQDAKKMHKDKLEKFPNKLIIGTFSEDGTPYFLTYEGEKLAF